MEALSDSSVTSGCSGAMLSPGLTMISMIGTSLKSPMSGTRTSATPAGALVAAGGADTAGFTGSLATPAPSTSSIRMGVPSLTLSPILTASDLTTPAAGEGTSIEALSDSSVISGASTAITLARLHLYLDDRHVLEVADVGHTDLRQLTHCIALLKSPNDR